MSTAEHSIAFPEIDNGNASTRLFVATRGKANLILRYELENPLVARSRGNRGRATGRGSHHHWYRPHSSPTLSTEGTTWNASRTYVKVVTWRFLDISRTCHFPNLRSFFQSNSGSTMEQQRDSLATRQLCQLVARLTKTAGLDTSLRRRDLARSAYLIQHHHESKIQCAADTMNPRSSSSRSKDPPPATAALSSRREQVRYSWLSLVRVTRGSVMLLILCHLVPLVVVQIRSKILPLRTEGRSREAAAGARRLDVVVAQRSQAYGKWSGIPLVPIEHRDAALPYTAVHCAGENYSPESWKYRSCEFRNLCLDATASNTYDLVALESLQEHELRRALSAFTARERGTITLSTVLDPARSSVSLGTASAEPWFPRVVAHGDGFDEGKGSPRIPGAAGMSVSVLPESVVLVPFSVSTKALHSTYGNENVIWDVLYPIYTLLSLFGLEEKQAVLLIVDQHETQSSETTRSRLEDILSAMDKGMITLVPSVESAIGVAPTDPSTSWICSKYAVAGLGLRRIDEVSGEDSEDRTSRSAAEGINLWAFRTFLIKAFRIPHALDLDGKETPLRVTVHENLQNQLGSLQRLLPIEQVQIHLLNPLESIAAIAKTIAESRVFVTSLEGLGETNLAWVTFLPRDSYFIILVDTNVTYDAHSPYGMRRMDWDLLNAAGYFHFRVLPLHDTGGASVLASTLREIFDYVRSEAS